MSAILNLTTLFLSVSISSIVLMIRLQRVGRKNIPTFRVVLTDKRNSTKSGKYLEALGAYDPRKDGIKQFKADRIKHWLSHGAQASLTVHNLLVDEKIVAGKKMDALPSRKKKEVKEEKKEDKKDSEVATAGPEAASGPAPTPTEEKKV